MASISVVLVAPDHHTRVRMRGALAGADVRIVGEACERWNAGELVRATAADVAVVDARLLSLREFFLTGWGPVSRATPIVVVGADDPGLERRLRAQGVAAYVACDRMEAELAAAVRAATFMSGHAPPMPREPVDLSR